nr:carbohydrate sulfotransferase 10-like [Oncorhynchus nerka]XP_029502471.1 carbohydrate sulfotransferase 10-like [Oncorhynchus nerka]
MQITMRHHWLLVGACGWVLLILVFANKFINFNARTTDDYGEKTEMQSWTQPGVKTIKSLPAQKSDRRAPKSSNLSSVGPSMANPTDWNTVEMRRRELLSAVCKNDSLKNLTHTSINKFVLDRIFVCDKHKILFCQTPKVGNTQWKKVLIVLNGE